MVVDLPKDIMNPANKLPYVYPESVSMRSYNPTVQGHKGQIRRALQTLLAAKKPIIYSGGGVINAECHEELLTLAEKLNLPVTTSLMGLGGFPARTVSASVCWGCTGHMKPIRLCIMPM